MIDNQPLNNFDGERINLDGEWLHESEIHDLYRKLQQQPDYEHLAHIPLITIDSSAADLPKAADEVRKMILDKKPLERAVYPFAVHSGAHWMTVVLSRNHEYTIANSLHNIFNMDQGPCLDFINKLEGGNLTQRVRALPDYRKYGFGRYCSHMWKRFKNLF